MTFVLSLVDLIGSGGATSGEVTPPELLLLLLLFTTLLLLLLPLALDDSRGVFTSNTLVSDSISDSACLVPRYGESLSEVSLPQLEDSESSVVNLREALGDEGGCLLQTCDWMCSQTLLNLRILPDRRVKVTAYRYSLGQLGFETVEMST